MKPGVPLKWGRSRIGVGLDGSAMECGNKNGLEKLHHTKYKDNIATATL